MTTTDEALTEQIARALRRYDAETNRWSDRMLLTVTVRDYLPAAATVLPIIRKAQADAWDDAIDEAAACGWIHGYASRDIRRRNPLRATETEETAS